MNRNAVVTGVLFIVVFIIGFGLGRMTVGVPGTDFVQGLDGSKATQTQDSVTPTEQGQTQSEQTGTTVNTSSLTESQKGMLKALGIDADSITITPEMVTCAEAKLGAARIEEIKNGATPSFSEGAALIGCYR
jgi:hypothetical protein